MVYRSMVVTITFRMNRDMVSFDPYFSGGLINNGMAWLERLHTDDWTLDPTIFPYKINFRPSEYVKGLWQKAGNSRIHTLTSSICDKEFTGRIYHR